MNAVILRVRGASKRSPVAAAVLFAVCGICLLGCESSFERQQARQRSTAAIGTYPAVKKGAGSSKQLTETLNNHASASVPGASAYKIGPLDVLEISVFKVPDLSKSVQVGDAGTINLPLAGEISVAGKTAHQVERDLVGRLSSRYMQNPQVTVYVREYNSQRATIEGAVRRPGVYPIKGPTTLVQLVAMAEGTDKESASNDVAIFRVINGKRSVARFDISDIRSGVSDDPVVMQGDLVIVDYSTSKAILGNILKVVPITATFVALL